MPDIRIERTLNDRPADVWPWFAESDKTAAWIGPWRYLNADAHDEARREFGLQMTQEGEGPESTGRILVCEAPQRLEVVTAEEGGEWHLRVTFDEIHLAGAPMTLLVFEHLDVPEDIVDSVRAGWNFYIDCMLAAKAGDPLPAFDDYWPTTDAD